MDDDDLKNFAERHPAVSVYLPDSKADQGAQGGVEGGVYEGGGDRVAVGEGQHGGWSFLDKEKAPATMFTRAWVGWCAGGGLRGALVIV